MQETWRQVVGYQGRYIVSNLGQIKSLPNSRRKTEMLLSQSRHKVSGHHIVRLTGSREGRHFQKAHYVHSLVLEAFVGPCPDKQEGCHKDGNPSNNSLSNLRWDTRKGNQADRKAHGTDNSGERNGQAKFTDSDVIAIKARLANGDRVGQIANDYGVRHGAISLIKNQKRWNHV